MKSGFQIGDWRVDVPRNRLVRADHPAHTVRIEPKAMQVLVYLAERAGEVAEKAEVVREVWEGAFVTDEVLTNAIWELRKALGDDSKSAQFIQTVPRKGYRLIAPVSALEQRSGPTARRAWAPVVPWILLGAVSLLAVVASLTRLSPDASPPLVARFSLEVEGTLGPTYVPALALSADASSLVYVSAAEDGARSRLHLRQMDRMTASPVAGTEGAVSPFFSPDGNWVGFFVEGKLRKLSLDDGRLPIDLYDVEAPRGAWWGPDGYIYFTPGSSGGIRRISEQGGESQAVTELEEMNGEWTHRWPQVLPGAKAVLFTLGDTDMLSGFDEAKIVVQSLASGERHLLVEGGSFGRYVPGHVVYVRGGTLMAAPFDAERLELTGPARSVLEWVRWFPINGAAQFALSRDGSLAYVPGGPEWEEPRRLVWVDRRGQATPASDDSRIFYDPALSPDGRRVAVAIAHEGNTDLWLHDVERGTLSRLTASGGEDLGPLWTPDGQRIAYYYSMSGPFQMFWLAADGSGGPEQIVVGRESRRPESWSPDGRVLVFSEKHPKTGFDIWTLDVEAGRQEPVLQTTFDELHGALSPDGRRLAYVSNESGRFEVYVRPFPGLGAKWQVSTSGGDNPKWTRNGEELLYRNGDEMMAVSFAAGSELSPSKPRLLFEWRYPPRLFEGRYRRYFDVSSDGERFLLVQSGAREAAKQLHLVLNWRRELEG